MCNLPELDVESLRSAQITATESVEKSLADQHSDRSLVHMATGAGKTYTAVIRQMLETRGEDA